MNWFGLIMARPSRPLRRAFAVVDQHADRAGLGHDLARRKIQVLRAKCIDAAGWRAFRLARP
jgi:hypothetical protein